MTSRGLDDQQLAAYFTLTEVGNLLQQAVSDQLRADGDLSPVQFQVLATLGDAGATALRMTDLADRIVYSRSGFSYQAAQLEKRGLIAREPSPHDERSTVVRLTDAGRDLLARVMPGHVEVVRGLLFEHMPAADLAALGAVLGPVRDRLRAAPPRSARPRGTARRADR
ncbi:MarR family winged helix-turn-helix transcriptional regulator [Kineococcus sp. SYSU DK002]|uniref:MarR family winged helix-turn-helix transcriptional regulator n=1 Tax=Kineococcus sp. SYSU DK002 TaxID=3383123 RepID=UPI003D7D20AB